MLFGLIGSSCSQVQRHKLGLDITTAWHGVLRNERAKTRLSLAMLRVKGVELADLRLFMKKELRLPMMNFVDYIMKNYFFFGNCSSINKKPTLRIENDGKNQALPELPGSRHIERLFMRQPSLGYYFHQFLVSRVLWKFNLT